MITRHTLAAFYDELEKISVSAQSIKSLAAHVPGLPSAASVVRQTALAKKVRIAKDAPRIIAGSQPRVISRRALRQTMEVPALQPAVQRLAA